MVDNGGNLVGGPQALSLDNHWQREPSVAYDTRTDNFMVAWGVFYNPAGPGAVHVRTVSASTGALGPVREVATGTAVYVPQVEYNDATGHFFVAWYTQPSIWGRTLAPDGTPVSNTSLVAYNYASYDGLGLAYNPVANTYFAIFHGRGSEDVGAQVSAAGVPDVEFTVTATPGITGNYNPRITSHNERARMARRHLVELRPRSPASACGPPAAHRRPPPRRRRPPPPPPPPPTGIELTGAERAERQLVLRRRRGIGRGERVRHVLPGPEPERGRTSRCGSSTPSDDGRLVVKTYMVPARSRLTLSLAAEVGAGAFAPCSSRRRPGADISVERSMYFGPELRGEHRRARQPCAVDVLGVRRRLARRRAVRQLLPALQPQPVDGDRHRVPSGAGRRPRALSDRSPFRRGAG